MQNIDIKKSFKSGILIKMIVDRKHYDGISHRKILKIY